MKLLNEHPVLDKGYVALYSCSPSGGDLDQLSKEFFRGRFDERVLNVTSILLKIKCPLFVQLVLAENQLTTLAKRSADKPEAFVPNVSEVNAQDLKSSELIRQDIEQTTAALLLNPTAYQMDHCDIFVSQVISPISMYNTLVVNGSLRQWMTFLSQTDFPSMIEAYRSAIENVICAEYPSLKLKIKNGTSIKKNQNF